MGTIYLKNKNQKDFEQHNLIRSRSLLLRFHMKESEKKLITKPSLISLNRYLTIKKNKTIHPICILKLILNHIRNGGNNGQIAIKKFISSFDSQGCSLKNSNMWLNVSARWVFRQLLYSGLVSTIPVLCVSSKKPLLKKNIKEMTLINSLTSLKPNIFIQAM